MKLVRADHISVGVRIILDSFCVLNVPGPNADLSSTASVILMTVPSTSTCDFAEKREDFLYTPTIVVIQNCA